MKRLFSFILTACLLMTVIPYGLVIADTETTESTEPVETVVVCSDTAYTPAEGEKVFTTVSAAITYLGAEGGTIYIKDTVTISGTNVSPTDFEGSLSQRGEVVIKGYGDTASGGTLAYGESYPSGKYLKGDVKFENLTITDGGSVGFFTNGHKMTFGEGLSMASSPTAIIANREHEGTNIVDIYSGTFKGILGRYQHNATSANATNTIVRVFGGTIGTKAEDYHGIFTGMAGVGSKFNGGGSSGDYSAEIYGGTINRVIIGHNSGVNAVMSGNARVDIYGGNISTVAFGNRATINSTMGNSALIIWSKGSGNYKLEKDVVISRNSSYPTKIDGKKFIAIINNSEVGNASFDSALPGTYVDYMLKVENGYAVPVFEGSGTSATLKGFEIKADDGVDNEYVIPEINGVQLTPDENGIYDLSEYATKGETQIIVKDSRVPVVSVDETFVPTANDRVFATVSEAIDYLGKAGGTVYVKGDISFENNNGIPLNFEGTTDGRGPVTITGYGNSNTAGSISFAYTNPGTAYIKGDIIFKNITIHGTTSEFPIAAIGHKITFGEGILTPDTKYYLLGTRNDNGGDHKIDIYSGSYGYAVPLFYNTGYGLIGVKASSEYNIYGGTVTNLYLGIRNLSSNQARVHSFNGNSVANVYGGTITRAYIAHEGSGNLLGDAILNIYGGKISNVGFANQNYKKDQLFGNAVISIYSKGKDGSKITSPISILKGDLDIPKNNESKKFIAIINNSEEGSHSFDASLTGDFCDYMLKVENGNAVPVFEETTAGDPSTSTLSGFTLTADTEGTVPFAKGAKLTAGEDGLYDLTAFANRGETVISFLDPDEIVYYENDKTKIVANYDCTVDLSKEEHKIENGEIFLGWKNEEGEYVSSTVELKAGEVLTADYDTFTVYDEEADDGEFYVYGMQVRITEPMGLRYIVRQKNSLLEKLGGAEKIIESGTLVLPTNMTQNKELHYGEAIYDETDGTLIDTPAPVPAVNIFKTLETEKLYTVVIIDIAEKNYDRHYSVRGYVRYYDANGVEQVVYSDQAHTSLYDIALLAKENGEEYDTINEIINVVEGKQSANIEG